MESNTYTEEYLDTLVQDWYLEYAAAGIEVGDPLYEWDNAHHPKSKKLGGTSTIPLMRKHHAIHGVVQSEVYQYPCISAKPWEPPYLPEEYLDLYEKWKRELGRIGGEISGRKSLEEGWGVHSFTKEEKSSLGRKTAEKELGIHNPEYRNSERHKNAIRMSGERAVKERLGAHSPEYRESEDYIKQKSRGGKTTTSQRWISLVDGFEGSPGSVAIHNKSIGADPSARVRVDK